MSRFLDIQPFQGHNTETWFAIEGAAPLLECLFEMNPPEFSEARNLPQDDCRHINKSVARISLLEYSARVLPEQWFSRKGIVHERVRICDVHYLRARPL